MGEATADGVACATRWDKNATGRCGWCKLDPECKAHLETFRQIVGEWANFWQLEFRVPAKPKLARIAVDGAWPASSSGLHVKCLSTPGASLRFPWPASNLASRKHSQQRRVCWARLFHEMRNGGRRRETDAPSPPIRGCEYRGDRRLWHALRAAMRLGELEEFCFSAQRDLASRLRVKSHLVAKRYRAPLQCHTLER